ncbi:unnamed protein product [Rotaria sp. Silwood2]|nr:unnamed protein product [Rotaria sp. Silwood2]CAF3113488.1 unnamed protein product [Rotaria sp. Silwood2]CAF3305249.1 unnamed protein product [Rotaria sp. Silwood2]CAF4253498.1 unnamed protein product [Rotaria sp. Silwood2]CAF4421066.1 unnamed protein product [Rotaria sp. Silwood2]
MFSSSSFLYFSFLGVIIFNELQSVSADRNCTCSDHSTTDLNLEPVPPRPGEAGSQVPPNWSWRTVLVDELCSNNPHTRERAQRVFQQNTLYSILSAQETQARNEYDARKQEYNHDKQTPEKKD